MTTDELTFPLGLLGQVGDPGGGIVPALTPTPAPGAMATASPGLGAGAATPAGTPAGEDPSGVALLIAKLAGQMFGGSSVAPVTPSPQQQPAATMPSAGLSPQLHAAPMPTGSVDTTDRSIPPIGGYDRSVDTTDRVAMPIVPFGPDLPMFDAKMLEPSGFEAWTLPLLDQAPVPAGEMIVPAADLRDLHEPAIDPVVRDLGGTPFDPYLVRRDFPILEERVHGKRLVWLDNAATTQKPRAVIDRLSYFYEHENSNIHRAAHTLAARATDAYEAARESSRRFLNAPSTSEIIFVRGTTEGINLIAQAWGRRNVSAGDEIVLTHLEHHANIVPWQQLAAEKGARLRIAPVDDRGDVILEEYEKLLGPKTKIVSFTQVSNALGTVTPAREMIAMAHRHGAKVLLDGAQAVSHMRVDVQELDPDFYVFSGHKVFAPTGIGVVWGKKELLEQMPPWQGGGNMIQDVTFEKTVYMPPPFRFEAGTGNIADAVGLGAALDYVMRIGMDVIGRYEHDLLVYATERLATVPGLTMIGTAVEKAGVLSFVLDGYRTEDVGAALDEEGIAVRSGHHCAQPILRRFGLEASVRASLAFYNVCEDIDALVDALRRLQAGRRS